MGDSFWFCIHPFAFSNYFFQSKCIPHNISNNNTYSPCCLVIINLKLNKPHIQQVSSCSNNDFLWTATVKTRTLYANAACVVNISGLDQTISLISNYPTTMKLAIQWLQRDLFKNYWLFAEKIHTVYCLSLVGMNSTQKKLLVYLVQHSSLINATHYIE